MSRSVAQIPERELPDGNVCHRSGDARPKPYAQPTSFVAHAVIVPAVARGREGRIELEG